MFLSLRELRFARGRFALMGSVVALIGVLMVLLSGLSVGLVNDGVSGLQKLPVTAFAFEEDVDESAAFSRSVVETDTAAAWAAQPGVTDVAPFGNALVNTKSSSGIDLDLALFGIEVGSWLQPAAVEGAELAGPDEVLLPDTVEEEGISVGDTLVIDQIGRELTVVGFIEGQHTYGHVDVGYVDLSTWQQVKSGIRAGEPIPEHVMHEVTAIALRGDDIDLAAGDAAAGTTSMTLDDSFGASPGYTAETATLQMIQVFLYAISALVVGAFFTVVTVQRKPEIAVLRAMGASTRYLLRDSLIQSAILLVVSTAIGIGIGLALGAALATTPMPFALEFAPVLIAAVLLIVLGMLGAVAAVLRITRVDPLTALGGNR